MPKYVEPLDPVLWFSQIEKIANGELGPVENSLRHAAHLLQLTPAPLRPRVGLSTDEHTFEALLDSGEFDTAARHLIAQPTALSIEPGDDARVIRATIKCSVLNRTIDGQADTIAAAVLDAWATCLLALKAVFGPDLVSLVDQSALAGQSGLHRQPFPR